MRNAALHLMDEKHVGVHTFLPNNDSSVVSPQLCNIQKWLKLTLGQHGKGVTGVPGGGGGRGGGGARFKADMSLEAPRNSLVPLDNLSHMCHQEFRNVLQMNHQCWHLFMRASVPRSKLTCDEATLLSHRSCCCCCWARRLLWRVLG